MQRIYNNKATHHHHELLHLKPRNPKWNRLPTITINFSSLSKKWNNATSSTKLLSTNWLLHAPLQGNNKSRHFSEEKNLLFWKTWITFWLSWRLISHLIMDKINLFEKDIRDVLNTVTKRTNNQILHQNHFW